MTKPYLKLAIFSLFTIFLLLAIPSERLLHVANAQEAATDAADVNKEDIKNRDAARQKLKKEQERLEKLRAKQQGISRQMGEVAKERRRLNKALIEMGKSIRTSEIALGKLDDKLNGLKGREKKLRTNLNERYGYLSKTLGLLQRIGKNPPPPMATHQKDALKMIRASMLMSQILPNLKSQADGLSKELGNLIDVKTQIETQRATLKSAADKLTKNQAQLEDLVTKKNLSILAHQQELQEADKLAKSHASSVSDLEGLISKLDQQLRERTTLGVYEKQLVLNEAEASGRLNKGAIELSPKERRLALANPGRIKPAFNFAQAKGTLYMPAVGKIIKKYGQRQEIGGITKGITLESRPLAQITSPCDGWIVYAGSFRSYGQLIIINAGGGYHILIAGLKDIYVKPAQFVLSREPLGKAPGEKEAGTPYGDMPRIYVEFRHNGRPINPDPWWLKNEKAEG